MPFQDTFPGSGAQSQSQQQNPFPRRLTHKSRSLIVRLPSWDVPSVNGSPSDQQQQQQAGNTYSGSSPEERHFGFPPPASSRVGGVGRGVRLGACRYSRMKKCRTTSELRIDL